MDLEPVARLQSLVRAPRQDLSNEHGRWRVYERAVEMPESFDLLRACITAEEDQALASSVVVLVLGKIGRDDRVAWIDALSHETSEFARRRADELCVLEDVLSGDFPIDHVPENAPNWSDWLQTRIANKSTDPRILEYFAENGRTKRIRRTARESRYRTNSTKRST